MKFGYYRPRGLHALKNIIIEVSFVILVLVCLIYIDITCLTGLWLSDYTKMPKEQKFQTATINTIYTLFRIPCPSFELSSK